LIAAYKPEQAKSPINLTPPAGQNPEAAESVEKARRRADLERTIGEFRFALDALSLEGWPNLSACTVAKQEMREVIGIEAGWTKDENLSSSCPPWLRGDWVTAAKLVLDISGRRLKGTLDNDKMLDEAERQEIEDQLERKKDFQMKLTDWKDVVRVLPVKWRDQGAVEIYDGDRGEKYRVRPREFGDRGFTEQDPIALLCKDADEATTNVEWICLPNGINGCREFHREGVPANLWKCLKEGNEPLVASKIGS